jgi:hypothetical protein
MCFQCGVRWVVKSNFYINFGIGDSDTLKNPHRKTTLIAINNFRKFRLTCNFWRNQPFF